MKTYLFLAIACIAVVSQPASAELIGLDTVDGTHSLYASDWGHAYNTGSGNEFNALGRGNLARAFEVASTPYGFSSGESLQITATGCTIDSGQSCTGPGNLGGDFRGLPVYSLIGLWSTNALSIVALDSMSFNPAFLIGNILDLVVPDFTTPLYLFMATNDGNFADNGGAYSVRVDRLTQQAQVPAPSVLWLMLFGLLLKTRLIRKRCAH